MREGGGKYRGNQCGGVSCYSPNYFLTFAGGGGGIPDRRRMLSEPPNLDILVGCLLSEPQSRYPDTSLDWLPTRSILVACIFD